MMERFKGMSPDEQQQFIARMKERGQDTSAFEAHGNGRRRQGGAGAGQRSKDGRAGRGAQTIDALFAPLPTIETRGRAWLFMNHQLKPVNMRLGISDGTNTELLSGELQAEHGSRRPASPALGTTRTLPTQGGSGNPLMPGGAAAAREAGAA